MLRALTLYRRTNKVWDLSPLWFPQRAKRTEWVSHHFIYTFIHLQFKKYAQIWWETMSFQLGLACLCTLHQRGDEILILGDTETLDRTLGNLIKVGSALSRGWTRWPSEVSPNLNYSATVRGKKRKYFYFCESKADTSDFLC